MGYAHGDPDAVPSVYMDYDAAGALGKKILEALNNPQVQPSLGEIARAVRSERLNSTSSDSRLAPISVVQDNRGRLVIYRSMDTASGSAVSEQASVAKGRTT